MQLPRFGGVGLNRSTARLLVLSAFYILFLVLGAAIFSAIEGPEETQRVRELRHLRKEFLLDHKCVSGEYWLSSLFGTKTTVQRLLLCHDIPVPMAIFETLIIAHLVIKFPTNIINNWALDIKIHERI